MQHKQCKQVEDMFQMKTNLLSSISYLEEKKTQKMDVFLFTIIGFFHSGSDGFERRKDLNPLIYILISIVCSIMN